LTGLHVSNTKKNNTRFKSSYLEAGDLKQIGLQRNTATAMVGFDRNGNSVTSGLITQEDDGGFGG
jgi:hypothetical protein